MTIDSQIFMTLKSLALEKSKNIDPEQFRLRGLWKVDYRYRPNEYERDLSYTIIMAQTLLQGACYVNYGTGNIDDSLLSKDVRHITGGDIGTEVSLLDAAYSSFSSEPSQTIEFSGNADEKVKRRAEIIAGEVLRHMSDAPAKRVLNVGVMGNFIPQLQKLGIKFVGSDFEEALLRDGLKDLSAESLHHGSKTLDLIEEVDVVLATGMTMTTGTLDGIVKRVKETKKKLVLFAATGAYFGEAYCREFGIDAVISEYQPQYMYQGTSKIDIFRS